MNWEGLFKKNNHQGFLKVRKKLKELGFKKEFKIFNVVGTNGKGSVTQYLSDSFIASGKKVGTFTSPHIFKPNERIKINNKEITNKEFFKIAKNLDFSFFETLFMVAMIYFEKNKIDIAIIEAGIGGERDTTKAVPGDYGTVTSIGLDHEKILGDTKNKIAQEKAGIINSEMSFFIPNSISPILREKFQKGNFKIIKNKDKNYKLENINLAKGIAKEFGIKAVIKNVPYRSQVDKINGFNAIKDVSHNYDGIKSSVKYLKQNNINYDKVVISIQKIKWKKEIINLFKNKKVYFYKHTNDYYSKGKNVNDIKREYNDQSCDTLYIGTFRTIAQLKKRKHPKRVISRLLLGNNNSFKLNIFTITLAAILISLSQILGYFLRFKIGPMEISFDYVFYMIFGLFFGVIYGSVFALLNDLLKSVFVVGFGQWMWQYAIVAPIAIVIISSLFKEFVWNKKDKWLLIVIITFISINILALLTVIINNTTSTYTFKKDHEIYMYLFYATLPILFLLQISLIILYKILKDKKTIRKMINSVALTMIIIVILSWIWGPFAFLAYANRFIYQSHQSIENKYSLFLIPRIIKAIPEGLIWSTVIFSLYEITDLTTKKVLKNRW